MKLKKIMLNNSITCFSEDKKYNDKAIICKSSKDEILCVKEHPSRLTLTNSIRLLSFTKFHFLFVASRSAVRLYRRPFCFFGSWLAQLFLIPGKKRWFLQKRQTTLGSLILVAAKKHFHVETIWYFTYCHAQN